MERSPRSIRARDELAGIIIDIAEDQIINSLGLAIELAKKLARINVKIAIDNFGKGYQRSPS